MVDTKRSEEHAMMDSLHRIEPKIVGSNFYAIGNKIYAGEYTADGEEWRRNFCMERASEEEAEVVACILNTPKYMLLHMMGKMTDKVIDTAVEAWREYKQNG
jgi:hypothetical protein